MSLLGELNVNYITCINNANTETITTLILSNAKKKVEKLETNPTDYNLIEAKEAVSQVTDETTKKNLEQKIAVVKKQIDDKKAEQKEQNKKPDTIVVGPNGGSNNSSSSGSIAKKVKDYG